MRPHAVASITGTVNGVTNPSYSYDANGNMTAGAGRSVTYTAFNMAAAITQGSTTTNFWYDPEHNRVRMYVSGVYVQSYDSDPVSGAMEEYRIAGSTTTWSDYIKADGQLVAMRSCTGGPPCTGGGTWTYFVTDELGTVVRATDSTGDPSSAHTERNAYDPWGRHRLTGGGDDATCGATPASKTTRGYTGHEQLNDMCLINANARIYDPTVARFMTPDSMVSDAMNVQDWNAYTYVNNRPLTLTDPTGHEVDPGANKAPTNQENSSFADLADLGQRLSNNPTLSVIWGSGSSKEFKEAGVAATSLENAMVAANASPSTLASAIPCAGCSNPQKVAFVAAHLGDAKQLATQAGHSVSALEILAWSAGESGWGQGPTVKYGNFFGLHNADRGPFPGQIGTYQTGGGKQRDGTIGQGSVLNYWTTKGNGNHDSRATPIFRTGEGYLLSGQAAVTRLSPFLPPNASAANVFFPAAVKAQWGVGTRDYVGTEVGIYNRLRPYVPGELQ